MKKRIKVNLDFDFNKALKEIYRRERRTLKQNELDIAFLELDEQSKKDIKVLENEISFRIAYTFNYHVGILQDILFLNKLDCLESEISRLNKHAITESNNYLAINFQIHELNNFLHNFKKNTFENYLKLKPTNLTNSNSEDNFNFLEKFHNTIENSSSFKKNEFNEEIFNSFTNEIKDETDRHIYCIFLLFTTKSNKALSKQGVIDFQNYFDDLFLTNKSFFRKYSNFRTSTIDIKYLKEKFKNYQHKRAQKSLFYKITD